MHALRTARLIVRPFALDDVEAAHRVLDLDLQWAGPGFSMEQRRERVQFHIGLATWGFYGGTYGDRAIVLQDSGEWIGMCGFRPWLTSALERAQFDPQRMALEHPGRSLELGVGYALSSHHRDQGYATEAVKALLEYAFTEVKVCRVAALTELGNHRSVNLMLRVGMTVGFKPDPEVVYPWGIGMIEKA